MIVRRGCLPTRRVTSLVERRTTPDAPAIVRLGDRPVAPAMLRDPMFGGGVNLGRRLCCVGRVGCVKVCRRAGPLGLEFLVAVGGFVRRLPFPTFARLDLLATWGAREPAFDAREPRLDDDRREGDARRAACDRRDPDARALPTLLRVADLRDEPARRDDERERPPRDARDEEARERLPRDARDDERAARRPLLCPRAADERDRPFGDPARQSPVGTETTSIAMRNGLRHHVVFGAIIMILRPMKVTSCRKTTTRKSIQTLTNYTRASYTLQISNRFSPEILVIVACSVLNHSIQDG